MILEHFSFEELKIISLVCRDWYQEIGFLWKDKLRLDFYYFSQGRRSFKDNLKALSNSKRLYVNVKAENNKFFKDTADFFKAISLRRNLKCKRLIKSLNLKGYNILQLEDIFNWVGGSLEDLRVSNIPEDKSFKNDRKTPSKVEERYFKIFSSLRVLSLKKISEEFQGFFKYFVHVTELSLHFVTLDQLKGSLEYCAQVRKLHLGDIHCSNICREDFGVLEKLKHLREIVIGSNYSEAFYDLLVKTLCKPEVKLPFSLTKFHLYDQVISASNIKTFIAKFPNLEDILIEKFDGDSECLKDIFNLKSLKSLRGPVLKCRHSFDIPIPSLTTVEIYGLSSLSWIQLDPPAFIDKLSQLLPNLETLYLKNNECGIHFEGVCELVKLKTLVLDSFHGFNEHRLEMKALEVLHIKDGISDYWIEKLEFPNLKKLTISQSLCSERSLLSIMNSEHLEFIRVDRIFGSCSKIAEMMANLKYLKDVFLYIGLADDFLQIVKFFISSKHSHFQFIRLASRGVSTSQKNFEKGLIELLGHPLRIGMIKKHNNLKTLIL